MHTNTSDNNEMAWLVEEIAGLMQSGQPVDWERLSRDYPAHQDELHQLLPTLQTLANLGEFAVASSSKENIPETVHGTLGDFRLIREVGRGGMGVVYEAEQLSMRRRVALKILPFAALISGNALQRFRNEVHAAATLDHPHIVSVYCVGEERGVHYYAMQLIRGQSLAQVIRQLRTFRNQHALDGSSLSDVVAASFSLDAADVEDSTATQDLQTKANQSFETRVASPFSAGRSDTTRDYCLSVARLAMQAAEALQHAHEHGIVHRDVKPGNLMLDGAHKLWITDFGLARTKTSPDITMSNDLIGTLRYMSPEQVGGNQTSVDHRTDIYSLGATLYELLTLEPVYASADRQELLRQIAVDEPPKPRSRNQRIPVELEIIALKSLEKEPADRYQTAQDLADDLRRLLNHEPIRARRPSLVDRLAKWTRRHKSLVTAISVSLLLLAFGLAVSTVFLLQKQSELVAERNLATRQQRRAEHAEQTAQAINRFLRDDVLAQADPAHNAVGDQITLLQVVDQAAQKIDQGFKGQPEVRASLHQTLAETYRGLGQYEKSAHHYLATLDLAAGRRSVESVDRLELMNQLGWVLKELGRFGEAEKVLVQSLEITQNELGIEDRRVLDTIVTLHQVEAAQEKDAGVDVEKLFQQHIEAAQRAFGKDDPAALRALCEWAWMLHESGEHDEAESQLRKVAAGRRRVLGADDPRTLQATNRLGLVLFAQRKFAEAEQVMRVTLEAKQRILGADHRKTLDEASNLGAVLAYQDKYDDAEVLFRTVLKARLTGLGPDHPVTLEAVNNLGWLLMINNRLDEATKVLRANWQKIRDKRGPDHLAAIAVGTNLGFLLLHRGEFREAEGIGRANLAAARQSLGPEHTIRGGAAVLLASVYCAQGRRVDADDQFIAEFGAILASKSDESADSRLMASCFLNMGDPEGAEEWAGNAVAEIREKSPKQPPIALATSLAVYTRARLANAKFSEAETAARECLTIRKSVLPAGHWLIAETELLLGRCLASRERFQEAESLLVGSFSVIDSSPQVPAGQRIEALESLVTFYEDQRDQDEVRAWSTRLEKELRQVLRKEESAVAENMLTRADWESRLGKCVADLERPDEAEKLLLSAFNRCSAALLEADRMSTVLARYIRQETIDRLVAFYGLQVQPQLLGAWELLGQLGSNSPSPSLAADCAEAWEAVVATNPAEAVYQLNVAESWLAHTDQLLRDADSPDELRSRADQAMQSYATAEKFLRAVLQREVGHRRATLLLSRCYLDRAEAFQTLEGHPQSFADFEQAIALVPDDVKALRRAAESMANCPQVERRQLERALAFAARAVELNPNDVNSWRILGTVQLRDGRWADAFRSLGKVVQPADAAGKISDQLKLAIVCWRLGDEQTAQEWYDRASARMARVSPPESFRHRPAYDSAVRLKGEAAELLGISHDISPAGQ